MTHNEMKQIESEIKAINPAFYYLLRAAFSWFDEDGWKIVHADLEEKAIEALHQDYKDHS